MEFSGFAYCAENKSFSHFPILSAGTLLQKSSDMGVHHSKEMPFVELTGHKVSEPIVHQAFQINKFAEGFGIAERFHHFATNAKHFVRSENILPRKDLYGHHFPEISFSQLVGGFVGSKSQIGSSSKETHQIWDIIFDKLVEFCGTHHNQDCYNFGRVLSQQVLGPFCHKDTSVAASSNSFIQNPVGSNIIIGKKSPDQKSTATQSTSGCNQNSSDTSKQSYAEVAKTFAINHQNNRNSKTPTSIMPRKKNPPNRRNLTRCQFTYSTDYNWRIRCNPPLKEFRNHTRFFSSGKNRPDKNRNYRPSVNFEKEHKTEERRRENCRPTANSRRVNKPSEKDPKKMTSNTVQTIVKEVIPQEVNEGGNGSCTEGDQDIQPSPRRGRCSSECSTVSVSESTASDDSFVIFDSEAGPVECMLEIDFSDDECFTDSSDEDDSDGSDCEESYDVGDDVTDCSAFNKPVPLEPERDQWKVFLSNLSPEMVELNLKWRKENSCVPSEEKIPAKICFADEDSLVKVHEMDTWNDEYHEARISSWMQLALDHERFQKRIKELESVLAPVLASEHRDEIWQKRFSSMPADT